MKTENINVVEAWEILREVFELIDLGLSEEEIQGYIEFFEII